MRKCERIILILLAGFLAAGCDKNPEAQEPHEHEFTREELQKKKVDEAFTVFFEYLDVGAADNPWLEVVTHSHMAVPEPGILRYTYVRGDLTLISMDVALTHFTARLYGDILVEGEYPGEEPPVVFIDGDEVATLGFVWYEYRDSGETKRELVPVFCFADGTSYAISGVLLVEPLIDYLLTNVFSTE